METDKTQQESQLLYRKYLKPSYFSGTLILVILARDLMIAKFNAH